MTFLELLAAAIILAFVCSAALTGWAISIKAPGNQRVTEMGAYIGTQEIERLKAAKYMGLIDTPQQSPNISWYDKYGAWLGSSATTGQYQVLSWVRVLVDRDGISNTEDIKELEVQVWDSTGTTRFETARSQLTFGGL